MTTQQRSPIEELRDTLGKMGGQFKAVMPTQQHVDRFIRVVMTAVQGNTKLLEAERNSFYKACMQCAQAGLLPDGKQAVLKIYREKDGDNYKQVVQYEPMTDGMLILLRNSGDCVGTPKVHPVFEHDFFEYVLGDNEHIAHKPPALGQDRGKLVGAYSIVKLKGGDTSREVMDIMAIDSIMQRTKSKTKDGEVYGPWKTDKPEMARKTVFKRHAKRLPRSTDLDNLISYDNEHNGIDLDKNLAPAAPAAAPAASSSSPQQEQQRPPALAAVAAAGGTPMPDLKVQPQREAVVVDQGGKVEEERKGPPQDII